MTLPSDDETQFMLPRWFFAALIVLGLAARFGLSAISAGALDAQIWHGFAASVLDRGVFQTYRLDPTFNSLIGCGASSP